MLLRITVLFCYLAVLSELKKGAAAADRVCSWSLPWPFSALYWLQGMQGYHEMQVPLADCECGAFAAF